MKDAKGCTAGKELSLGKVTIYVGLHMQAQLCSYNRLHQLCNKSFI